MAYHITTIINNSDRSVALTNPAPKTSAGWADSRLVPANESYSPERPILVNKTQGDYNTVVSTALNIYTKLGNWCFWDNSSDEVDAVEEGTGSELVWLRATAGDLTLTIDASGKPMTTKNG
jgi:hypothetical protein